MRLCTASTQSLVSATGLRGYNDLPVCPMALMAAEHRVTNPTSSR